MCSEVTTSPTTGQRDVSRAEHVGVAAACRPLSVRLTSVADLGTTEAPWHSSSSRQSSCMVEASTFDLRNDEPDGVRLKWLPAPVDSNGAGTALGGGGGCWSRTTADCCARLPPAMLVCNKSRLKSYRAADRSSPRGRYRSDWRSGDRRTTAAAFICGCVRCCFACTGAVTATVAGCWPSNRFFDSWMAAYRSMADRPDAGRTYGCCAVMGAVRCLSPGGDWGVSVRCSFGSWICGRPVGLTRQSRIGDMLLLLMSIRPALRSSFTGVDADTFRSWPTLRSRPLLSPLIDVEASGLPRLVVSKMCTRKIGCYTCCESLWFTFRKVLKYRLPKLCMDEGCR